MIVKPQIPVTERFERWLVDERHISMDIAKEAGIIFDNGKVKIPVKDTDGKYLFTKYRRSPLNETGPKYQYEVGAKASIFGLEHLYSSAFDSEVIICEGELDALALRSLGYVAVSTTGGAGTWKAEWAKHFENKRPVIAYDADRAGVEGALRVASMLPGARIAWLPVQFGKDPTDIIHSGNIYALKMSIALAKEYTVPGIEDIDAARFDALKELQNVLSDERKELNIGRDTTPFHRDLALVWVQEELAVLRDRMKKPKRVKLPDDKLERAKLYPIKDLVKANRDGFAKCVYHAEQSASMKVYHDNHAFSYCCSRRSDAIDIYCAINNCPFKEAVDKLSI